jgi:hypothetical protein
MGVAVIAGLTVATVLTLVIVPVTYHSLDSLSGLMERLGQGDARRRREATSGLSGAEIHARRAGEEAL